MELVLKSIEDTEALAVKIAELLNEGDILCLSGDLGAGKTTFSQFLAKHLGVTEYVTSPTFAILNVYSGRCPIYHFDVYRISDNEELADIGYEEYFFGNGISIIEWADLIKDLLPNEAIWMEMRLDNISDRICTIRSESDASMKRLEDALK